MSPLLSKNIPVYEPGLHGYHERLVPQTIFKATLLGVIAFEFLLYKISFRVKGK